MKKSSGKKIIWVFFSVVIGIFVANLVFSFMDYRASGYKREDNSGAKSATAKEDVENNPAYHYFNKETKEEPRVAARAYLVGDLNTGEIILSKNENREFPIASVSKLMTALIAQKLLIPEEVTEITKKALTTEGQNGELRSGEKIKIADLLYPLLLESSNDAAEALAIHFDRENFITKMNQEAKNLQMNSTFFMDPSGLSSENSSTVSDLFKLTGYINKEYPNLLEITTKRSYSTEKHNWFNISQFLGKREYAGGKSGYTSAAKQTVISVFDLSLGKMNPRSIAIALLQSPDRRRDIEIILQYLKKNIYYGGENDATTDWVKEKIKLASVMEQDHVNLTFVGDIMLDRGVKNSVVKNFSNDYSALFEKTENLLPLLQNSDIFFANLEGPVSDQGVDQKNLYSFRMNPSVIPALKSAGISIVSLANNHMADWGRSAFLDTLSRLEENEILYTGGGANKTKVITPTIIEKYGMKIGFLGFSDVGPNHLAATEEKAGILLANDPNFDAIVKNAASQVDYLIVTFHFGEEYQQKHNARQEFLAHRAIDNGARIIIGTHPHVVEDTEIYKNGYIAYSLGNFIFDQSWSKPTMQGVVLQLKIFSDGSMTVTKNPTEQNSVFQINKVQLGDEERIRFQ